MKMMPSMVKIKYNWYNDDENCKFSDIDGSAVKF